MKEKTSEVSDPDHGGVFPTFAGGSGSRVGSSQPKTPEASSGLHSRRLGGQDCPKLRSPFPSLAPSEWTRTALQLLDLMGKDLKGLGFLPM